MTDFRTARRTVSGDAEVSLSRTTIRLVGIATSVASTVATTMLTYTPTADTNIIRIGCGGEDYAKFQLFIDTVLLETKRSGPDRYADFSWAMPFGLDALETLQVKVTHFHTGDTLDFDCALYAFPQPT